MKQNCACFEKLPGAFHHHAEINPPPRLSPDYFGNFQTGYLESHLNGCNLSRLPGEFPGCLKSFKTDWKGFRLFCLFLAYFPMPLKNFISMLQTLSRITKKLFWAQHSSTFRGLCDCWHLNNDDCHNQQLSTLNNKNCNVASFILITWNYRGTFHPMNISYDQLITWKINWTFDQDIKWYTEYEQSSWSHEEDIIHTAGKEKHEEYRVQSVLRLKIQIRSCPLFVLYRK